MTYEQALEWVIENWDMYDFDMYEEWRNDIFLHFRYSEGLEESATFNRMLERVWISEFGSLENAPVRRSRIVEQEIQEPVIREPTAREVEQDLLQNLTEPLPKEPVITESKVFTTGRPIKRQEPVITQSGSTAQRITFRQRFTTFFARFRRFRRRKK